MKLEAWELLLFVLLAFVVLCGEGIIDRIMS